MLPDQDDNRGSAAGRTGDRPEEYDDPIQRRPSAGHLTAEEEIIAEFQELLAQYREFNIFGAEVQRGITESFLKDEEWCKRVAKFMDLSDIKALEEIHEILARVVDIMPSATSQGINVFSTIASHHSNVTKNTVIKRIIDIVNAETVKDLAEE